MPGAIPPERKTSRTTWELALQNAKKRRMWPTEIPLKELAKRHRASADQVANIVIRLHVDNGFVDPLVPRYIEHLIKGRYTGSSNILLALLRHSRFSKPGSSHNADMCGGLPSLEEQVFALVREYLSAQDSPGTGWKAHGLALALTRWLHVARKANARDVGKQLDSGVMHAGEGPESGTFEALGLLAIAVFGHRSFREIEKQPWWKTRRPQIVEEMEQYDMHVLQWIQSQFTGHLQALAKTRPFLETDEKGTPIFTEQQILDSVSNIPIVQSRAGLFVWLSACLSGRPLTDEATMRNYLLVRYNDSPQNAAVDLQIAAFDVLTNAVLRQEPPQTVRAIRSFICNKVPLLLQSLLGFSAAVAAEQCIQMAFMAITIDPLAPLSAGATDVREVLQRTRKDFLFACALHSSASETTVAGILQEPSVTQPKTTKYTKEALISQCTANSGRLENVIEELEAMQGNAGAVSGCVVDMVANLCANKDTMTLKVVCQALMKKPSNLDVVLQYCQPAALLLPLCNILNDWVHDQDQSEFQPPYEEFACMLLLLLTAVHRFDLDKVDLGLTHDDNFVARLLEGISQSFQPAELKDEQRKQLAKWIEGLYATDEHGETTGIGDEVMSQCPPQAFYVLVPTLFEQSVLACKSHALSINTAKGGLEFLLEPFLLPSLIGGITWLVKHSWEDHDDADILLQILDKLLRPSSTSQEMQTMHKCILSIVASPLETTLEDLIRRKPDRKKPATSLLELLKPHLHPHRAQTSRDKDLEAFTATGSVPESLRAAVRDLAVWASSGGSGPPPKYSPTLLPTSLAANSPPTILHALASELRDQTSFNNGPVALDICTALVNAPTPSSYTTLMESAALPSRPPPALPLREALRLRVAGDPRGLLKLPTADAEALVRLHRLVEAQASVSNLALDALAGPGLGQSGDPVTDQVMQDLGLGNAGASDGNAGGQGVSGEGMLDAGAGTLGQDSGTGFDAPDFSAQMQNQPSLDLGLEIGTAGDVGGSGGAGGAGDISGMMGTDDIFGDLGVDFSGSGDGGNGGSGPGDGGGEGGGGGEEDIFAGLEDWGFS